MKLFTKLEHGAGATTSKRLLALAATALLIPASGWAQASDPPKAAASVPHVSRYCLRAGNACHAAHATAAKAASSPALPR